MGKNPTIGEIVEEHGWLASEAFHLLQNGLPAYTKNGKQIVDKDTVDSTLNREITDILIEIRKAAGVFYEGTRRKETDWPALREIVTSGVDPYSVTDDEIAYYEKLKSALDALQQPAVGVFYREPNDKNTSKNMVSRALIDATEKDYISAWRSRAVSRLVPEDCFPFEFTPPLNDEERDRAIEKVLTFVVKAEDYKKYTQTRGIKSLEPSLPAAAQEQPEKPIEISTLPADKQPEPETAPIALGVSDYIETRRAEKVRDEEIDHDSFIKEVRISCESDIEIKITAPGHSTKKYDFKDIGFGRGQTKGWKDLIQVLETGFFSAGTHEKNGNNAEYERRQKRLTSVNKKLIAFFVREYDLKIPDDFKFFRLLPDDLPGTYGAIFQIMKNDSEEFEQLCAKLSEEELISRGKTLLHELDKKQQGSSREKQAVKKMRIIAAEATKRGRGAYIAKAMSGSSLPDPEEVYASDVDQEICRDAPEDFEQ